VPYLDIEQVYLAYNIIIATTVIFWLSCGGFAAWVAEDRNRRAGLWLVLGFLFGIVALIAVVGSSTLEPREKKPFEHN
jgi:hypothetical protein